SFQPDSQEYRPLFKIAFVVDDSVSMAAEQAILAQSVRTLLNGIRANAEFHVITTSEAVIRTEFRYQDSDANPVVSETAPTMAQAANYQRVLFYDYAAPAGDPIMLRTDMEPDDIELVKNALTDRIIAAGTSGSSIERPLCSAIRAMNKGLVS